MAMLSSELMMNVPPSAKSFVGIDPLGKSTTGLPFSARIAVKSMIVNFENHHITSSGSRLPSNGIGGIGRSRFSFKLTNGVNQSSYVNYKFPRMTVRRVFCALMTEFENAEVDKITETKEEVLLDSSRKRRVQSTYLDKSGKTKLISVQDFLNQAPEFTTTEGPARWFCSTDAKDYPPDAPLLLFVPGMDSTGLGLLIHQKKLARLFEVHCLHIPIHDRTSFVGLLQIVEQRIREEYDRRPGPIYVMGESFGACLALSVAARNPELDLVLVIVNPATSFADSPLQPVLPLLKIIPDEFFSLTPFIVSFIMGDPVKMASASVDSDLPAWERLPKVLEAMRAMLPSLPVLADIIPKEVLIWKLKLIADGARYTNSRLRGVKSDVLLLASGKDQLLPSKDEARRLRQILPQLRIRYFRDSGHTLLLEEGLDVASLIKVSQILRHKKNSKFNPVTDFRPPFPDEVETVRNSVTRLLRQVLSPVFLSVTEDGRVRRGLPDLPEGRPILLVGNHTLIGLDLGIVVDEFLVKKGVLLRGLAHPILSLDANELEEPGGNDMFKLFGIVPVTGKNLYELLSRGEATLLYPGGVREALKRKGERYKLFWSETAEFVRTAIRHGATIIPFATVGGDDVIEILLDSNELVSLPVVGDYIKKSSSSIPGARMTGFGEVRNESFVHPVGYPNLPPRIYFIFKQPIPTEGMLGSIKDRVATEELYLKVKGDVESGLEYLVRKRNEDAHKDFIPRVLYEAFNDNQAPTFEF